MCLAVYKPAGLDIPKSNLQNAYESNSDGCGLCWAENGELHVEKGMMTFDNFYAAYEAHKECSMLIHFRKSTHGKKDTENCHPFLFNDGQLALIHNGVIPIKCSEDGYSDTWHFVNKILDPIVREHGVPIDDQALSWFIRVSIGTDKVAVMDTKGETVIFNEEKGNWEDTNAIATDGKKGKVWYSNFSFRYGSNRNTGYGTTNHTPNYSQSHLPGSNRNTVRTETDDSGEAGEWEGYGFHNSHLNSAANKPLEIANDKDRGPGKMTEYGWYDGEIEEEIESVKTRKGFSREDAIIDVFNNA
jgi:glutamine amidotransferase